MIDDWLVSTLFVYVVLTMLAAVFYFPFAEPLFALGVLVTSGVIARLFQHLDKRVE